MRVAWTRAEVEALVSDYMKMLACELRQEPYSKTAHRNALSKLLDRRSDGSIERKHQNVSAVLIEHRFAWIPGYKPLANYQRLLAEVVAERLDSDSALELQVRAAVERPMTSIIPVDILTRCEAPPKASGAPAGYSEEVPQSLTVREGRVDYLDREARNVSLGSAGEEFAVEFERVRLRGAGRETLADRVEHVARTKGDGLGFDVHSFETDGSDRFIEVKTTAFGRETPFFVTRNELAESRRRAERYHVYRLFRFRLDPRFFVLTGAIDGRCRLEAVQYTARIA